MQYRLVKRFLRQGFREGGFGMQIVGGGEKEMKFGI